MLKYTPQAPSDSNVNVSQDNPVVELLRLLGGISGLGIVAYVVLGFAVELLTPVIPASLEQKFAPYSQFQLSRYSAAPEYQKRAENILAKLRQHYPNAPFKFRVVVKRSPEINAIALPAGYIMIFTGLMDRVKDDNELAFVLAHELGHFNDRDHLKGLGRGLFFLTTATCLLGADNTVSQMVFRSIQLTERQFSQQQERDADRFGLRLLDASYHHVGGSLKFFNRLKMIEVSTPAILSTHPPTEERIQAIQAQISKEKLTL